MRIPIPDRPGAAAEIFTLAAGEGINIASFEVVHLAESNLGVAVVLVDADAAEAYRAALARRGSASGGVAVVVRRLRAATGSGPWRGRCSRIEEHRQPGPRRRRPRRRRQHVDQRARRRRHDGDAALPRGPRCRRRSHREWRGARRRDERTVRPRTRRLDAGLAGTTSRFVTALAALADQPVTIDGDPPLRNRPMGELHDALRDLGAGIDDGAAPGQLPVTVTGPLRRGGTVRMRGDVSSQFVTALMLIGPLLDGRIAHRADVAARVAALRATHRGGDGGVRCHRRQCRRGSCRRRCGRLHRHVVRRRAGRLLGELPAGGRRGARRSGHGRRADARHRTQGDIAIVELLSAMGCDATSDEHSITIARDPDEPLRGIDVDMAATSDLVPTIAAIAVTASTPTTIRGVGFIRAKESDRLGDLARELARTGAHIGETADGLHGRAGCRRCRRPARRRAAHPPRPPAGDGVRRARLPPSTESPSTTRRWSPRAGPGSGRPTTRCSGGGRAASAAARRFRCAAPASRRRRTAPGRCGGDANGGAPSSPSAVDRRTPGRGDGDSLPSVPSPRTAGRASLRCARRCCRSTARHTIR